MEEHVACTGSKSAWWTAEPVTEAPLYCPLRMTCWRYWRPRMGTIQLFASAPFLDEACDYYIHNTEYWEKKHEKRASQSDPAHGQ